MKYTRGKKLAVLDTETDPFQANRLPVPFCCAFYDGSTYLYEEGDGCMDALMRRIAKLPDDYVIYAHNGGKFDFWFLFPWIDISDNLFIINGRLVEWPMIGSKTIFRDSMAIIPVSLATYHKETIDYKIFESGVRDKPANKVKIQAYLKSDCINLFELVSKFAVRFEDERGNIPISIGQASIRDLMETHPFETMTEASDRDIRPWYFGGRVQCFASGVIKGPWKVYDVNSMYPFVMSAYDHPLSDMWEEMDRPPSGRKFEETLWFAEFKGINRQALGSIADGDNQGITFDRSQGVFQATSHEVVPAIKAGMVEVTKWLRVLVPSDTGRFDTFVAKWQKEKEAAERKKDKAARLFAKLIMNSAYGKTGQNPETFKDYRLLLDRMRDRRLREDGYEPDAVVSEEPFVEVWSRPSKSSGRGYYNVGIAASVTSAARAVLLEGLQRATRPIYCDTDSIICRSFSGPVHETKLGSWKHEATADYAAIAGKKMYVLYDLEEKRGRKYPVGRCGRIWPIKWASKGGKLTPSEILKMAKGGEVEKTAEVPTYSFSGGMRFITRKFKATVAKPRRFK